MSSGQKIAILGRRKNTANYEAFLLQNHYIPLTTMEPRDILTCGGLLLPGGGDITPAFFGEHCRGSRNIDTELDILQYRALELCLKLGLPVLGICKGMQLINVALGGTIIQDMADSSPHLSPDGDLYHSAITEKASPLYILYGEEAVVNSAHHQCIDRLGSGLRIIQRCAVDGCPEALSHETLPVLGVQWHPERLDPRQTKLSGAPVLSVFEGASAIYR